MGRRYLLTVFVLMACGGSQKSTEEPTQASDATDPGTRCVEVAQVKRQPPPDAPIRMDLAHIVIRHAGVRNAGEITRTREEACLRAEEVRKQLLAGADWEEIYQKYSDSKDATQGTFSNTTQSSLEDKFGAAAFSLQVDELSHVVETPNGFHVIWRKQ